MSGGARVSASSPPLFHATASLHNLGDPRSSGFGVLVVTQAGPGPDQALAACRVTSARGLSLPLCSHLSPSSLPLYFPIPLSKALSLLASSCHAQTLFFLKQIFYRFHLSIFVFVARS